MQTASVYVLVDDADRPRYVGFSKDPGDRARQHYSHRNAQHPHNVALAAWLRDLGHVPRFVVLEADVPHRQRLQVESAWTLAMRWSGADGLLNEYVGATPSAAARAKGSASQKGRSRGPHSEETRRKIGDAHRGKVVSVETRAKLSEAKRGVKRGPLSDEQKVKLSVAMTGKKRGPISDEHRARISVALTGRKHTPESRAKMSEATRRQWVTRRAAQAAETRTPEE